jgi:hypothetical protein
MGANDLLDYLTTTEYEGLLEGWWHLGEEAGGADHVVIMERNAAQRFMTQYDFVKQWQAPAG